LRAILRSLFPDNEDGVTVSRATCLWSSQRKSGVLGRDEVVLVAGSCDRSHSGRVNEPALDEPIVDVDTEDLPEGDVGINLRAIDVAEPNRLQPSAFQRAR
jgi:hypothetical protein